MCVCHMLPILFFVLISALHISNRPPCFLNIYSYQANSIIKCKQSNNSEGMGPKQWLLVSPQGPHRLIHQQLMVWLGLSAPRLP